VFETAYQPIVEDGRVSGVIGVATDVTGRRERERKLERQNERLEEFVSLVSHDLQNPLNVAAGRLELADEECESDHLDAAARALDRMDELIADLLRLAREGERVNEIESVALADVVEECWHNVATGEAELVVETTRTIRADPGRLQHLLENLLRNAVEHGSTDGTSVTITVGDIDGGFYVEDDGPGIPEAKRSRVFESGYSTSADGTGFGLAIVKEVAEAHEWSIRVTESADGGARFEITGVETDDA
jgi:signal transduction histidine kinase